MRKLQSFSVSAFTKPTRAHQNCMQTSYTKFYPYWTIDVESTDGLRHKVNHGLFCAVFYKLQNCSRALCGNSCTGFIQKLK
jgi:hypothetical protein